MTKYKNLLDLSITYYEALPARIRDYLRGRGIPDEIIDSHLLGWNGWRISIPIYNRHGEITFFRLAKDPQDNRPDPKMLSSRGSTVELYGWDHLLKRSSPIVICEGEFDRLVLEAHGFAAVTSTGGAATFRPEWAKELEHIEQVYICFDRDNAGHNGAQVVALMIPHARIVQLPDEVGEGGDVTDYFVRLGRSREEFFKLLEAAKPAPEHPQMKRSPSPSQMQSTNSLLARRIRRIKTEIPIETVISKYVQLHPSGKTLVGRCPFHDDRTPSFAVYPQNGNYHCFGCRAHGDLISFVQRIEGMSFGQALEALGQHSLDNGYQSQQDQPESKAA